jgi:type IV pilus biogenesis protein CpaD/CtpE
MKKIIVVAMVMTLTGCANMYKYIPSFWDDNQSAKIIDVRQKIHNIDCTKAQAAQADAIVQDIQWFRLYSDSKGRSQQDVLKLVEPMEQTAIDWARRSATQEGSRTYCEIKKKVLIGQIDRAAGSVLGRW